MGKRDQKKSRQAKRMYYYFPVTCMYRHCILPHAKRTLGAFLTRQFPSDIDRGSSPRNSGMISFGKRIARGRREKEFSLTFFLVIEMF